jgi:hypothetical protein
MSVQETRQRLAAHGFNLTGCLAGDEYDARVPEPWGLARVAPVARGVIVVGHAGRALWPRFRASPEYAETEDPLDRYTARCMAEVAASTSPGAHWALYSERREGSFVPLVALARRAGLGTPGRIGVLLHPEFGPWISFRALLFVPQALASAGPLDFAPCAGCDAPCARACHGNAVGAEGLDSQGCYATRLFQADCALRCDARSACVVGPEHAYPQAQLAHHYRIRRAEPAR